MAWDIVYQSPSIPLLLGQAVLAENEGSGSQNAVATISGVSAAGVCLIGIGAVITAQFVSIALNNGNTFPAATINAAYTPNFGQYSLQAWVLANATGGSNHAITLTKSAPFTAEETVALIALSAGGLTASSSVVRNAAGAGATLTSANFTVPAGKSAKCVAIWSGTGDVNVTPPTATMVDSASTTAVQWGTPIIAIARGSGTAPNGHIPLYVWTAVLPPGTYTWAAQPAIDEGAIMATLVCQV